MADIVLKQAPATVYTLKQESTQPVKTITIQVGPKGDPGEDAEAVVDSGSRASPNLINSSIPVTSSSGLRIFIKGNGGPVTNPTITNVSGNKRIILFGTDDTNYVSIAKNTSNFELRGLWIGKNGSRLQLEWDGASKYTEVCRNEI